MKKIISGILIIVGVVVLLALSGAFYVVDETQQVVITQFGEPVGKAITTPGLKIKVPFIQKANFFDKRFLEWDGAPNQIPTRDKRFIWIDSYARWQIDNPLLFFQRLHDERGAQSRLDDIIDGEARNTIANHDLIELVRSTNRPMAMAENLTNDADNRIDTIKFGREKLTEEVLKNARKRTSDLGIEILDFRFKRIDYVEDVRKEVYQRMISERKQIAERFRSEGAGEAARISGQRDRDLKKIESEAYQKAQKIRGAAEAEATDIYAAAYSKDPDFYRFLKTMQTLQATLDNNTTMVLSTHGEFLRYLGEAK